MNQILAVLIGAATGAAFKPLSDPLSRKLLENRNKDFISDRYSFLTQLAVSAGLGAAVGYFSGFSLTAVYLLILLFFGNVVATTDIQYRLIPNDMVLAILGTKLVFGILSLLNVGGLNKWNFLMSLAGLAVLGLIFFLPSVFGNKIGIGDLKLAMAIGFSAELIPALMAVALMGILVFVYGVIQQRVPFAGYLKSKLPMGPFLCASQIMAMLLCKV